MAMNIEIKAHARNYVEQKRKAELLGTGDSRVTSQVDTFFIVQHGRLKLRRLDSCHGQLIHYLRPDCAGPKRSDYVIFETDQPDALVETLSRALELRGVVSKIRTVIMVEQTRLHFDDVKELGKFIEIEVVLKEGQTEIEGRVIAEALMEKLGILKEDLIEGAYIDLI